MHDIAQSIDPLPKVWDPESRVGDMLRGRRGLVVGIANEHSIAYGCAVKLHAFGAELAVTYLNEKAEHYVRPLAEQLQAELILPLDVEQPGQLEAVFERIRAEWGGLDFVIHSIAFAPRQDLHGRVVDCSLAGFQQAMRVSCYSFIEMARLAEPLITPGGALLTMSYYGADKVVNNYNIMGPVKAALEATTRYLAAELGEKDPRVRGVAGPAKDQSGERHRRVRRTRGGGSVSRPCPPFGRHRRGWAGGRVPRWRQCVGHDWRHDLHRRWTSYHGIRRKRHR